MRKIIFFRTILSLMLLSCTYSPKLYAQQQSISYYVSSVGSDNNNGSINSPFATIARAQQEVERHIINSPATYNIVIRKGTYFLQKPLVFDSQYYQNTLASVNFIAYNGEEVTISGGKAMPHQWIKTSTPNVWKLTVPTDVNTNSLLSMFKNNVRLMHANSDTLFTKGPVPQFSKLFGVYDFGAKSLLQKDSLNVFSEFVYSGNDLDNVTDIGDAELLQINSWEASWHTIYKIDKINKIVYLKNPATYPVGFFSNRVRYIVLNIPNYLKHPGEWYVNIANKVLYYYADNGENPNENEFIAPFIDTLISAVGDGKNNQFVNNIKFTGIRFAYTASTWGFNGAPDAYKKNNAALYKWLDFSQGFSGGQTAIDCGAAIVLKACKNWIFEKCTFEHIGNYALNIGQYSSNNTIENCTISDGGGGGVIIGFNYIGGKTQRFPDAISPSGNKVINCHIHNCGAIFPAAVALGIMQANHTTISHNYIYNLPYTGISVGWTFSAEDNYTTYNTIEYNYIHNVMGLLADGGGIYTLGKQVGSVYKLNHISNVYHNKNAIGAHNNGFFFDQYSSQMKVDSNVVSGVKDEAIRFNVTQAGNLNFGTNYFEKMNSNSQLVNPVDKKIQLNK